MADYELDANPKDRREILRRDRELRDAVAQMNRSEKRTFIEFLQEATGNCKAHIYKCLKTEAEPSSKEFRTLFSYGKSKIPSGVEIPSGANAQDVMFNLKLRIADSTVRGTEKGRAEDRVKEGTRSGESTRGLGNSVTGLDTEKVSKYLLNDRLFNPSNGLEPKLFFQSGGSIYFQFWHESPESFGNEDETGWDGWNYDFSVSDLYG